MALLGNGEIKPETMGTPIYVEGLYVVESTLTVVIRNSVLTTGATIPDPADVKKDVVYSNIYRVPKIGTFEGGSPAKISDRG